MNKLFWIDQGRLAGRCGPGVAPIDLKMLKQTGFKYLLSLDADEHSKIEKNGLNLETALIHLPNSIPPQPWEVEIFESLLPEAIVHVRSRLARNDGAILVHCHAGNDRTGGVLTGVLMCVKGLSPSEGLKEVRKVNPEAISAFGYEEMILDVLDRTAHTFCRDQD